MDAKDHNCYIVLSRFGFLQAKDEVSDKLVWSIYKFDAAPIKDRKAAVYLARKFDGTVYKFNHATGRYID